MVVVSALHIVFLHKRFTATTSTYGAPPAHILPQQSSFQLNTSAMPFVPRSTQQSVPNVDEIMAKESRPVQLRGELVRQKKSKKRRPSAERTYSNLRGGFICASL